MLTLDNALLQQIKEHAAKTYPDECCGVLLGRRDGEHRTAIKAIPCRNSDPHPSRRYAILPSELIAIQRAARESKVEMVAFYHSHPDHPPTPSPSDIAEADWSGCSYVIVSIEQHRVTGVRSFTRVEREGKVELLEEALAGAVPNSAAI